MLGLAILRRWRDLEVAATRLIILLYKKKKRSAHVILQKRQFDYVYSVMI